jgi:dienelactone hydrolase
MNLQSGGKKFFGKAMLAGVALAGLLAFGAVPRAYAEDYDACQRRVAKADHKLHEAVEHHGWDSKQADRARNELRQARERCWKERQRWWDEDGHRWHTDRDWDDHDHDRH